MMGANGGKKEKEEEEEGMQGRGFLPRPANAVAAAPTSPPSG